MTDARTTKIWQRAGSAVAFGTLVIASVAGPGCSSDDSNPSATTTTTTTTSSSSSGTGGSGGMGEGGAAQGDLDLYQAANNGEQFSSPFDATPDPDGENVYFTGINADGNAAVFKAPAAGGDAATLSTGDLMVAPFGIATSTDGTTLYIADTAAEDASFKLGLIFKLPVAGGTPEVLAGTEGTMARGLEVYKNADGNDEIWFSGRDKETGEPGLFSVPAAGTDVKPIAEGAPFEDPSGVAITATGDAYVVDTKTESGTTASIISVKGGTAAEFLTGLGVGFPAGNALIKGDATLLVSGLDIETHVDVVYVIDIATKALTKFSKGTTVDIGMFNEPAGLHRAKNGNVFAWADSKAQGTGTVYVVK